MKILFTGGGSGGHFYPIIAIADALLRIAREERLIPPRLFFMGPSAYDERLLFDRSITFVPVAAGKVRRYLSVKNIIDLFKTAWGLVCACVLLFRIFPDIVVGKGGFGSFPALVAARLFNIPVLIHESDSVPGRVNRWAGRFAGRVAVSFPEAATYFPNGKIAYTGNPIRKELLEDASRDVKDVFGLQSEIPTIAVLGGSQGAATLNEVLLRALPELLHRYQVVHQTGTAQIADITARATVLLEHHPESNRYHLVGYLSTDALRALRGTAALIISRAGSTIFEIAAFGIPSILIPISDSNGNHQRENAYAYARSGAARVVEETNLTPTILLHEIQDILDDPPMRKIMAAQARLFAKTDAAEVIAREILGMALKHER
ncbi:MAG: UDP diphospho-muramoyl pentapeptide beta-N acetylglucosaminyl transferase [Parcubacteria group bacterium Greene0416_79]|nr:MAG: UDP diphospho-muramoyl pentapeptide beta-N acetylglucosaminyl transferase [Parcubacteria group bacterium Greene0416_79]